MLYKQPTQQAIFKRTDGNIDGLIDLANITIEDNELDTAREILTHIKEISFDDSIKIEAEQQLLDIDANLASTTDEKASIKTRYEALLNDQGTGAVTVPLQIDYAHFMGFEMGQITEAVSLSLIHISEPTRPY